MLNIEQVKEICKEKLGEELESCELHVDKNYFVVSFKLPKVENPYENSYGGGLITTINADDGHIEYITFEDAVFYEGETISYEV